MHVRSGAEVQALARLVLARLELTSPPNFFTVAIQQPGNSYPSSWLSLAVISRGLLDVHVQGFLYPELDRA